MVVVGASTKCALKAGRTVLLLLRTERDGMDGVPGALDGWGLFCFLCAFPLTFLYDGFS